MTDRSKWLGDDADIGEGLSNFEAVQGMGPAIKRLAEERGQEERARQREGKRRIKVFVWQSGGTTIISFGSRSRNARTLAKSLLPLTAKDLKLLEEPHNFSEFVGKPAAFDNRALAQGGREDG